MASLDEIELRRKALLSFSKHANHSQSSPSEDTEAKVEVTPVASPSRLQPPVSQPNSRFIVTLNASSDDSNDEELHSACPASPAVSVTLGCTSVRTQSVLSSQPSVSKAVLKRSQTATTLALSEDGDSSNCKKISLSVSTASLSILANKYKPLTGALSLKRQSPQLSLESYKKLVLRQATKVEQLKLILKRQQKLVLERKKTEAKLTASLATLRAKLQRTLELQTNAHLATLQVNRQKSMTVTELQRAQQQLLRMNSAVEQMARRAAITSQRTKPKTLPPPPLPPPPPPPPQMRPPLPLQLPSPTFITAVKKLKALLPQLELSFRISSPFFGYFSLFEPQLDTYKLVKRLVNSNPSKSTVVICAKKIDPLTPICPFFLDGNCLNSACKFQHPSTNLTNPPMHSRQRYGEICSQAGQSRAASPGSCAVCPVCNTILNEVTDAVPPLCDNLTNWHSIYANFPSSEIDWTRLFVLTSSTISSFSVDRHLMIHHLYTILQLRESLSSEFVSMVINCLACSNFSVEFVAYVISHPSLNISLRRQLLRAALRHLLREAHSHVDSFKQSVRLLNPITTVVFYTGKVEWDVCRSRFGLQLADDLLGFTRITWRQLPPGHPARWGVWYLRLLFDLCNTFPQDHFIRAVGHVGLFETENLLRQANLFRNVEDDLGFPTSVRVFFTECQAAELSQSTYSFVLSFVHVQANLFRNVEDDLGFPTSVRVFFTECQAAELSQSTYSFVLSFVHVYVQFLAAAGQFARAAAFCLSFLEPAGALKLRDNLLFATAVNLSSVCLQAGDVEAFECVSSLADQQPLQSEYAFLFACLMHRSGKTDLCCSLLSELVASLVLLPSVDVSSVYPAFRVLLGLTEPCSPRRFNSRFLLFLWMCCGLYSTLTSSHDSILPDFLHYLTTECQAHNLNSFYFGDGFPFPCITLLIHLGLCLAASENSPVAYNSALETLLFLDVFTGDSSFCASPPPWFLELLQQINWNKFTEEHPPNGLCVRLVETYGYNALKVIFGSLLRAGHIRLLQSLCLISRLERPIDETFWLMVMSLGIRFLTPLVDPMIRLRLQNYLLECFTEALTLLPQSCLLWRHYAATVRDFFDPAPTDTESSSSPCTTDDATLLRLRVRAEAARTGMEMVVDEVFDQPAGVELSASCVQSLALPSITAWWGEDSTPCD
ncbi:unnamed protein product [Schistocephalus solidus]|uniref:C3H1-type domain-containing protein n=1 Tax=Schistocephalus solidus TaxID=70667 RepID=A0A183TQD2_SCHSO|nr:unnamed protein product [Schistocephalus solidus]